MSLTNKLVLAFSLVTLLPLAVIIWVSHQMFCEGLKRIRQTRSIRLEPDDSLPRRGRRLSGRPGTKGVVASAPRTARRVYPARTISSKVCFLRSLSGLKNNRAQMGQDLRSWNISGPLGKNDQRSQI
jgi:hypothetical protein